MDFLTTARCKGPTTVITDLGILATHPTSGELILTSRHPGVSVEQIRESTGWPLIIADRVEETAAPSEAEVLALRELNDSTQRAHDVKLHAA